MQSYGRNISGVLIAGGTGPSGASTSTELFLPHTGTSCSLQSLPDIRYKHSMDKVSDQIILCGGGQGPTQTSCLEFVPTPSTGSWKKYKTLAQRRYDHNSFAFKGDLILLGGAANTQTTEIVGKGRKFNLKQDTR